MCQSRLASTLRVEGGVEMDRTTIAVDVAKSVFEVAVSEHPGQVRASSVIANPGSPVHRRAAICDRGHGSVWISAPLGTGGAEPRAPRRARVAPCGPPLCPPQQDGPDRCQGTARGVPETTICGRCP